LAASARIEVAELVEAVIRWNRGPLGDLAGHPITDPRVQVHLGDIRDRLEAESTYDAILLDVDNGPEGLTQESNRWLYGRKGLARLSRSLAPRGVLSVWSASADRPFTQRLAATGFSVQTHSVRARANGKGPKHTIWVATKR
jgi:spermidine synthase